MALQCLVLLYLQVLVIRGIHTETNLFSSGNRFEKVQTSECNTDEIGWVVRIDVKNRFRKRKGSDTWIYWLKKRVNLKFVETILVDAVQSANVSVTRFLHFTPVEHYILLDILWRMFQMYLVLTVA